RLNFNPTPTDNPEKWRFSKIRISSPLRKLYANLKLNFFSGKNSAPIITWRIKSSKKPVFSSVTVPSKSVFARLGLENETFQDCSWSNVKCQRIGTFSNFLETPKVTSKGISSRKSL